MPLLLSRRDITRMDTDAIVNAANESLLGGGGVDGAIHRAAGPELVEECRRLGGCRPGEAKGTGAYRLPSRYIIHTVGPRWRGGSHGEEATLRACYRNSLALARELGCESIAFPLISGGIFGYPREEAIAVAKEEILRFLREEEMTVYLILFGRDPGERERFPQLARRLAALETPRTEEDTVFAGMAFTGSAAPPPPAAQAARVPREAPKRERSLLRKKNAALPRAESAAAPESLEEALKVLDESFSQMLLRKITEKGMTDAACYKKANIDRKLFSKIRSDPLYRPSKPTALAFAAALELPLPEAKELLMKAGFALSRSSKFDVIVEYFLARGEYDIFRINEALFAFDQPLLGS